MLDYFNVKANHLYLSKLLVEIDQSCSGPQIYSLLSMDKEMAHLTNLLSEKKEDLYINFLQQFKIALTENWQNTLDDCKLTLLQNFDKYFTRKSFSKLIIMPTFYNMGDKGIRTLLHNLKNDLITDSIKKELVKIIRKILVSSIFLRPHFLLSLSPSSRGGSCSWLAELDDVAINSEFKYRDKRHSRGRLFIWKMYHRSYYLICFLFYFLFK